MQSQVVKFGQGCALPCSLGVWLFSRLVGETQGGDVNPCGPSMAGGMDTTIQLTGASEMCCLSRRSMAEPSRRVRLGT